MDELMMVLEWLGAGLAGLVVLAVIWMIASIVNSGRRDRDWE